jgi:ParB/RepB/Spo0J family partition protein
MEFHPFANAFPLMEGEEFDNLVKSIRESGLINPIVLFEDKILDGRNRYRACKLAGVEPDFVHFEEQDPDRCVDLVEALNIHRRHLSDSQRAMIAGRLVQFKKATRQEAAQAMNVSERSISKAVAVLKEAPSNVVDLVQRGKVSVHQAEQVAKGKLPVSDILAEAPRHGGRPRGNSKLHALKRSIGELLLLEQHMDELVKVWPGDPDLNARVAQATVFLASLSDRTQEPDHAAAVGA